MIPHVAAARASRRGLRVALAALVAAASIGYDHGTARPAAATDCAAYYCATIQLVQMSGTGSGHITSDPSGIDCTETPSGFSGTCWYQFSWSHAESSIYVDLTISATTASYVCIGTTCSGPGGSIGTSVGLSPGDYATLSPIFSQAFKATVTMYVYGNGAGRVTTTPAGLDCRWANGVKSGTCVADYYSTTSTWSISLHRTPDPGSYACSDVPHCAPPGQVQSATLILSSGASGPPASFFIAVPVSVTVAGSGTVVSNPAGIACPPTCSKWFPPQQADIDSSPMTMTAYPAPGWYVKDWTGDCNNASGTTCSFWNGISGAKIGVVLASTATPAPTSKPTARPTAAPAPGASAGPPTASAAPIGPSEASPVPSGLESPAPGTSAAPADASPPATPGGSAPLTALGGATDAGDRASGDPAGTAIGTGPDLVALGAVGLLVLVAVLVLGAVAGFLAGRRGRRERSDR
jgi:hypothetical protein